MHQLETMKKRLTEELESYAGVQQMNEKTLCEIRDLAQTIHYLNKLADHAEMEDGGASMRGGSYRGTYEGSYADGGSYRRGRDSMGRFVSRDGGPGSGRGSYDGRASVRERMEEMRRQAGDDQELKFALDQCMQRIAEM